MPFKVKDSKADVVAYLASCAGDKACVVCYYYYLKDYLVPADRKSLYLVSTDCNCDFASECSSDRGRRDDSQKDHDGLDCFEETQ